jgi:predicted AAA+ superfamily ATPase
LKSQNLVFLSKNDPMIGRQISLSITGRLPDSKVIILLGPRQAGKTTLLKSLVKGQDRKSLWLNGDYSDVRELFVHPSAEKFRAVFGDNQLVVIDEAQRIEDIGLCLKIMVDEIRGVKIIASGSSSFELANKVNEPLTGRKWEYTLYPLSIEELFHYSGILEEKRLLEHRLVYGFYPDVVNNPADSREILTELANSYLYKDILTWEKVQKPAALEKLVQALAFQVGNEVSYHELGKMVGLDNETVERYIGFLEKAFIVFRLPSFSRNLRNELNKSRKIYFYDNGLRNAAIQQFSPAGLRSDIGALWENFLISERIKYLGNNRIFANRYFWRTQNQQEIDYIEERDGILNAFEFKWNPTTKAYLPKTFQRAYPEHRFEIVNRENYQGFVCTLERSNVN